MPYGTALELTNDGGATLDESIWGDHAGPGALSLWGADGFMLSVNRFDANEHATRAARLRFPLNGYVNVTDRYLYRANFDQVAPNQLHLQRWNTESLASASTEPPPPLLDAEILAPPGEGFAEGFSTLFDDRALAFTTGVESDPNHSTVSLIALSPTHAEVVATAHVAALVTGLAVAGDRLIALTSQVVPDPQTTPDPAFGDLNGLVLLAFERRGNELVEVSRVAWPVATQFRPFINDLRRLLSFDGKTLYFQVEATDSAHSGLVALSFGDLAGDFVTYPLPTPYGAWSFASGRMGIVYNSPTSGVYVARPWCGAP